MEILTYFLYVVCEEIAHTIKGVRTIAKAKIAIMLVAAILGGLFIWWIFGESGAGNVNRDGMGDANARIERARSENERAADVNQRIEGSIGRLEREQQRIESGNKSVEDVADRAERILDADRASLERIRAVVNQVEKRRAEKADKP
ncbi:hypothetical protein [Negativicoccus succinicivorans]|uniref:hypothetical protein n=1 Tax=Negativicoccus succinicivorans TaxID=620903 RepID=UPI0028FE2C64|nr:hypothetical protein [Negativicoccus succinicivorans]MDU2417858.1 hypothetical protein [Negativicoccus succinicivorans]